MRHELSMTDAYLAKVRRVRRKSIIFSLGCIAFILGTAALYRFLFLKG